MSNLRKVRQLVDLQLEAHVDTIGEDLRRDPAVSYTLLILDRYGLLNHDRIGTLSASEYHDSVQVALRDAWVEFWEGGEVHRWADDDPRAQHVKGKHADAPRSECVICQLAARQDAAA